MLVDELEMMTGRMAGLCHVRFSRDSQIAMQEESCLGQLMKSRRVQFDQLEYIGRVFLHARVVTLIYISLDLMYI